MISKSLRGIERDQGVIYCCALLSVVCVALVVFGACGERSAGCKGECPSGFACDEESGFCVELENPDVSHADISPVSDAAVRSGLLHAVVFDRLRSAVLYGVETEVGGPLVWQSAALVKKDPSLRTPRVKLLASGESPAVAFESERGVISIARRKGLSWKTTPLAQFKGPLAYLDGLVTSDGEIHLCAADAWGALNFVTLGSNQTPAVSLIKEPSLPGIPSAPCAAARMGGKTSLLVGLLPQGLAILSQSTESPGWKGEMVDAAAAPMSVAWLPTGKGMIAAWLDRNSGAILAASGATGKVTVQQVGEDVVTPGDLPPSSLARFCLGGDSETEDRPYLGYFSHTRRKLEVRRLSTGWTWDLSVERACQGQFVPSVVFARGGRPVVAGVEVGGVSGMRGAFKVLMF